MAETEIQETEIQENEYIVFPEVEVIHTTNPEEEKIDDFAEGQQNFVTGVPGDDEIETEEKEKKGKGGIAKTLVLTGALILIAFVVAIFFIMRGNSKPQEATVKDNTSKLGVNSNIASSDLPNFQEDYQAKYGSNTGVANPNANTMLANTNPNPYGTIGDITAPPQPNYNGSIYQPNPNPSPATTPGGNNSSNPLGGGGGNNNSTPTTRINPDRNTEIVELPKENQDRNVSNGGGRNDQVSLYFYDRPDKENGNGAISRIELENSSPVKPPFGTVLPIRVLGKLHTLGTNGLARMELTRTMQGSWGTIPRGTMFVGRVSGGEANRLFVSLIGYIDLRSNRLITLGGDLQGIDGALGMQGDVKRLVSRWSRVFGELLSTAKQIGSAYLLGRSGGGTVINNGQAERIPNALENKDTAKYVVVPAGANGYIVLNDLPPAIESDERLASTKKISDEELLRMIQTNSSSEIERIIPGLSADGQQIARRALEEK